MTTLNINQIKQLLPHQYPFLLIDRVLELEINNFITCIKNVTVNEPHFQGHFPDQPVMPGVLMLEGLAQAAGILRAYEDFVKLKDEWQEKRGIPLFAGLDNVRFKRIVQPGDQLRLQVDLIKTKKDLSIFKGTTSVDEELACSAELKIVWQKNYD